MSDDLISLEESLESAPEPEKFDLLIKLSLGNFKVSPDKAMSFALEAAAIAESENSELKRAAALNALGKAHLGKLNHVKALDLLLEALTIYEEHDSTAGYAEVTGNLGTLHLSTGDPELALEYFERCRDLYSQMNNRKLLANTLNSMGLALLNSDQDDKALTILDQAHATATEENDKKVIRSAVNNKGILLYRRGNYESAVECFKEAQLLSAEQGELRSLAGNYINIGTCSIKLGKNEEARENLARGVETAENCGAVDFMIEGYYSLSELSSREKDYKKALEYHRMMRNLDKKLYTADKSKAVAEVKARYETEKIAQDAEINRLKNIELAEKSRLIETQSESLQKANEEIGRQKEKLLEKNSELEKILKEKDQFLRRMVAHISDGVIIDDPEGNIIYANDRFLKIFGLSRIDLEGYEPFSTIAPEWRDRVREVHRKRIAGEPASERLEFEGIRKDGKRIWLEVGSTVVENNGTIQGTQSIVRDVTERKELEAQLLQSQRLDAVGQLAGGIAHDFNNLLTVIKGHSEFILADLPDSNPLHTDAEEIRKATDRAASLTRQLLAFSKQQPQEKSILDLRQVVSGLQRMLSRLLCEDIELVTEFGENTGCVLADENQIEQVIVNLVINARDAMESGGKIIIGIENKTIGAEPKRIDTHLSPGRYVLLSVADSGKGMDADTKAKVFEPFFSTKPIDRGNGLGLAMAYGIIKQSNGLIEVESEPGKGSKFSIYLPLIQGKHSGSDYHSTIGARTGRGERILLVEDDKSLRRMSRRFLEHERYHVESAGSAERALEMVADSEEVFDLLLTDIVLPGMNGFKLAEELRKRSFKGHILYMTGYANETIHPKTISKGDRNLLEKPFSLYSLSKRIRETLDSD